MMDMESVPQDRPMRFGEMLVTTFRFLRRHPAATLGIGALLGTATSAVSGIVVNGMVLGSPDGQRISALLNGSTMSKADVDAALTAMGHLAPYLAIAGVVSLVVQLLAMGVMTLGMVRAMRGEPVRAGELWSQTPWARIVTINVIVLVVLLVAVGAPTALALIGGSTSAALLALAAAAALSLLISVVSTLAVPSAIVDDLAAVPALRRALGVVRSAPLRAAGITLGSLIVWDAFASLIASPIAGLLGALAGAPASAAGSALQSLVSGIVTGAITLPATASMAVLLYVDLARRSDRTQ